MSAEFQKDPLPRQDALWDVLGRATPPPEAHRLAERVLRRIRTAPQQPSLPNLFLRWAIPAAAAAAVAFALLMPATLEPPAPPQSLAFEEVANLEELVAASAGWAWSEVAPLANSFQ